IDLRINVPVGDQKIQPGVIVHIEKGRAPADVGIAGLTDARCPAYVVESLGTHIAIKRVGLLLEVSYKKTETSVMVIVAPVDAHVAQLHAFATKGDTGEQPDVGEGAVVIVVVQII